MPKKISKNNTVKTFNKKIDELSKEELKEFLMITTYKLAITRAQLDATVEILIKNKLTSYEDIWKRTNEIFKENDRR